MNNLIAAVQRELFDLGFEKIIQQSFVVPPLYRDFCILLIKTFIDHWVPRMLFVHLID